MLFVSCTPSELELLNNLVILSNNKYLREIPKIKKYKKNQNKKYKKKLKLQKIASAEKNTYFTYKYLLLHLSYICRLYVGI